MILLPQPPKWCDIGIHHHTVSISPLFFFCYYSYVHTRRGSFLPLNITSCGVSFRSHVEVFFTFFLDFLHCRWMFHRTINIQSCSCVPTSLPIDGKDIVYCLFILLCNTVLST
jgi:hypothetical protein